ncbi:MAG: hypothetical protein AAF367_06005 [Pseudomonadota bacterium]
MMHNQMMDQDQFETLLSRWGSDMQTWPDMDRKAAQDLIGRSVEAATALREMAVLETRFAQMRREAAAPLPRDLEERVLADAAMIAPGFPRTAAAPGLSEIPARRSLLSIIIDSWRPAAVFTASTLLGLWIGYSSPGNVAEAATAFFAAVPADEFVMLEFEDPLAIDSELMAFYEEGSP